MSFGINESQNTCINFDQTLGQPHGFPPKTPQPPPRLGACPGAAQGFLSSTHLTPHFSLRLRSPVWLLVTGPTPLNSSPTPPVYAWSVSQDLISFTARPELASWTTGSEKTSSLFNSSMGVETPACQVGGQRTPPWAETLVRKARCRSWSMMMLEACVANPGIFKGRICSTSGSYYVCNGVSMMDTQTTGQ